MRRAAAQETRISSDSLHRCTTSSSSGSRLIVRDRPHLCASPGQPATARAPDFDSKGPTSDDQARLAPPRPRRARGGPRRLRRRWRQQRRQRPAAPTGGGGVERHLGRQLPERRRGLPRPADRRSARRAVARRRQLHADLLQGRRGRAKAAAKKNRRRPRSSRTASSTSTATPRSTRARRRRRSRRSSCNAIKRCIDKAKSARLHCSRARGAVRFRTGSDPGGSSPKDPSPVPRTFLAQRSARKHSLRQADHAVDRRRRQV